MVFSRDEEKYRRGLKYEVLDECITIEIAWHNARLDKAGDDSEQGRKHFAAIKALVNLSESLHVDDESIERGWLVLNEMKAKRTAGDIAAIAGCVIVEPAVA